MAATAPKWAQKTIILPPQRRACHLVTPKIGSSNLHLFRQPLSQAKRPSGWIEENLILLDYGVLLKNQDLESLLLQHGLHPSLRQ
ncbi:hypothetical protein L1049_008437 [Liquidambar formosana]|uniref:Uncharacterized protein n=1 Tax=Liquidambar formosana TaxID=63359 RepID=A0AAP0S9N1_LIQFO